MAIGIVNNLGIRIAIALCGMFGVWAAHATESTDPRQHVQAYYDAWNECSGNSNPEAQEKYCSLRDHHGNWLIQHGWCYGPKDAPSYKQRWAPCAKPQASSDNREISSAGPMLAAPFRSASDQDWSGATFVGDTPGWYRYQAQGCLNGDRISCEFADSAAKSLRASGWCTDGTGSAPCPGYVIATPEQWSAHLQALDQQKAQGPRPKIDMNNPYAQLMQKRYKDFIDFAEFNAQLDEALNRQ